MRKTCSEIRIVVPFDDHVMMQKFRKRDAGKDRTAYLDRQTLDNAIECRGFPCSRHFGESFSPLDPLKSTIY